jgi:hypothetical protein
MEGQAAKHEDGRDCPKNEDTLSSDCHIGMETPLCHPELMKRARVVQTSSMTVFKNWLLLRSNAFEHVLRNLFLCTVPDIWSPFKRRSRRGGGGIRLSYEIERLLHGARLVFSSVPRSSLLARKRCAQSTAWRKDISSTVRGSTSLAGESKPGSGRARRRGEKKLENGFSV